MLKTRKYLITIFVIVAVILTVFLLFRNQFSNFFSGMSKLSKPEDIGNFLLQKIEQKISAPGPLTSTEDAPKPFLTEAGVINWTNKQRIENNLPPLKENKLLDASAKLKVDDMFKNQYFEHVSPTGIGVDGLVKKAGYEYILIGENLAMGNFQNSEKVVEAWMNSPGHRENILNNKYQEIGVAVFEGIYNGRKVWMAVQHFGLPMSYCSKPSEQLKIEIQDSESQLDQLKDYLDILRTTLDSMRTKTQEEVDLYNQKVKEYNSDLNQYNLLVEGVKNLINNFNNQVNLFNQCLIEIE
ncbi:MAG: CAP domain-containing protein [bacterium]|nr:CAP domain-containing protein [bacterium]